MILNFDEFLNEGVHVLSFDRLKDALKDIMMTRVEKGKFISVKEVCELLKNEYNINITIAILDNILDKWDKKNYEIFSKKDKSWMDYFPFKKEIKRPDSGKKEPIFGKGRKKGDTKTTSYNNRTNYNTTGNVGYNRNKTNYGGQRGLYDNDYY